MSHQSVKYNTLDVFTTEPFRGNQLGLVHVPASLSSSLSQETKQSIVIEFNYSETVFLHESAEDGVYNAQIFTPKSELPFAGHPTVGTAVWIFENLAQDRDVVVINLKAGPVHARFDRTTGIATAAVPHAVRIHAKSADWNRVAWSQKALAVDCIGSAGEKFGNVNVPIVSPVNGINFALVDLSASPQLLGEVVVTKDNIPNAADLDAGWDANLIGSLFYVIDEESAVQDGNGVDLTVLKIRQRVMVIDLEDPATGAASVALASYLSLLRGGEGTRYRFELTQGVEMGRKSLIYLDVKLTSDGKQVETVELSGAAVEVMNGIFKYKA